MNIAVNTRLLLPNRLEGIGWFSYQTLKRICNNHPDHNFFFIFDRPYSNEFIFSKNITPIVLPPPTRHPILWYLWFNFMIPKTLKKIKADVFLSPDGMLSLYTKVPQVPVIHDINFMHNPRQLPFFVRNFYCRYFPKFAKIADNIVTVSEYSRNDISKFFDIKPEKITVCYNSTNELYTPIEYEIKLRTKQRITGGKEYFIFIGALNPRKNIPGLLKSYELFRQNSKFDHKLVIVGAAMHLTDEINKTLSKMRFKHDVIFLGRLPVKELHLVLASAFAMVYIPFFEGFGIPLVEAMSCDVPIISGNTTSLPEVVGDAALLCSPTDHQLVAEYMTKISENDQLRNNLINKGRIQKEKFSWDISASNLWKSIEKAANKKGI